MHVIRHEIKEVQDEEINDDIPLAFFICFSALFYVIFLIVSNVHIINTRDFVEPSPISLIEIISFFIMMYTVIKMIFVITSLKNNKNILEITYKDVIIKQIKIFLPIIVWSIVLQTLLI